MTMTDEKLKDFLNSSGFPLQIGVEHLINSTTSSHGWKVLYKEHSWKNADTQNSGFIDLVLVDQHGSSIMVIECKRVQNSSWIFLLPSEKQANRRHARAWVSRLDNQEAKFFDWTDITADPTTPESQFCVVPGQDHKSRPMLERVASEFIEATEALAYEDFHLNTQYNFIRMYINLIITTAELHLCRFDPSTISIETGMVDDAEFTVVPFLRFRKSLSTKSVNQLNLKDKNFSNLVKAKENTVFIVNSGRFQEFLNSLEIDDGCFASFR